MSSQTYTQLEVDGLLHEAKYETAKEIFDVIEQELFDCSDPQQGAITRYTASGTYKRLNELKARWL